MEVGGKNWATEERKDSVDRGFGERQKKEGTANGNSEIESGYTKE